MTEGVLTEVDPLILTLAGMVSLVSCLFLHESMAVALLQLAIGWPFSLHMAMLQLSNTVCCRLAAVLEQLVVLICTGSHMRDT